MKIRASIKKMTRFWGIALCVVLAAAIMVMALTSCKEPQPDSPTYEVLSLLKEKNYIHAKNLYNEKISGNEKEERLMAVRQKYLEAFEKLKDQERVAIIDADTDPETVAERVWEAVQTVLKNA
jgi:thymidylate kinase